jgi:iron complex outermembrane recepter protein
VVPSAFIFALSLHLSTPAQPAALIAGRVVDSQGATVPDATVRLERAGVRIDEVRTGSDGLFEFRMPAARPIDLVVTAPGFAQATRAITDDDTGVVEITLQPAPFFEAVQVTSARGDLARVDPTITTIVFSSSELLTSPSLTIDDALKTVAGFTLIPSSRVSTPTTQTVMLRGLGGSGVNRSLVLADGVPLNDAFGGWVYWDKVPQAAIDRIEVLRGGGSDLYGADAVGGVVQILTLRPLRSTMRGLIEAGGLGTGRVSMFGGGRRSGWIVSGAGQWFTTDGYIVVAESDRGAIDTPSGSMHRSVRASVGYQAPSGWRLAWSANVFSEDRTNGTPVQGNDTDARQFSGELASEIADGLLSVHVFGGTQTYDETFSEISAEPPRLTEHRNRLQRVPTRVAGFALQWSRGWGPRTLLVGTEARFIKGSATETRFTYSPAAGPFDSLTTETSEAGGTERLTSAFVRTTIGVNDRWTLVAGAHADAWQSASQNTAFRQTIASFNPRAAVSYRFGDSGVSLRGSVYGGFRAPTLNELYRGVHVGNDVTDPNEALRPETMTAGDGGLLFTRGAVSVRATGFWAMLDDTVTNVTIATSPSLNIRQRQNADGVRSAGVELEADLRLSRTLLVGIAGAIIDSRFTGKTRLKEYRVPQVARDSIAVNVRHFGASWTLSGQLRIRGPQFEDDVNALALRRATVVDVLGRRTVARGIDVFLAVENLLDADYDVGRVPVRLMGLPRAIRVGAQLAFP